MSLVLVLDAAAISSLGNQRGSKFLEVRAALEAARRLQRDVVVPAVILAELYRGRQHNQTVDACLSTKLEFTFAIPIVHSRVWLAESYPQQRPAQKTWLMPTLSLRQ